MITPERPNAKALHELLLYYLTERYLNDNKQVKRLIACNIHDPEEAETVSFAVSTVPLAEICYISVGMVVHADEKVAKGAFELADLVTKPTPQADTGALERQIDALVYELYGLKEEEIAVVEGKET